LKSKNWCSRPWAASQARAFLTVSQFGMPKSVMEEGFMAAIMPQCRPATVLLGDNGDPYEDSTQY
jgi:hypothetical protein